MEDVLREHAIILRSLADELDSMANVIDKPYAPTGMPALPISHGEAVTDARTWVGAAMEEIDCQVAYRISQGVNLDAVLACAMKDIARGHWVKLFYQDYPELTTVLMPENLDIVKIPRPW